MPPQEASMTPGASPATAMKPAPSTSTMLEVSGGSDDSPAAPSSQHQGFHLRWSRLQKEVDVKDAASGGLMGSASISASFHASAHGSANNKKGEKTSTKVILDQVSGAAAPGEVMAVMGPSGSGKTSLMNVLSGRASYQSGAISINGDVLDSSTMKKLMRRVAYVKQADVFFAHLSVEDQLTYTALLRLPSTMTTEEKHAEVQSIIEMLRLGKVAQSPLMMVSGGEKKRVNIGTELLTNPMVVLLDEPTSGLDSTSAVSLLGLLQSLAKSQHKTIIASIHQPSSAMFHCFSKLYFISEGHVVYFGTPAASLDYLSKQKFPCPPGYNAADHWMDLLVTDSAVEEERQEAADDAAAGDDSDAAPTGELRRRRGDQARAMVNPRIQLQQAWDNEAVAGQMDAAVVATAESLHGSAGGGLLDKELGNKYPCSWGAQYRVLTHRALKNSRSAIFTPLNLIKSLAIGILVGLLWFQLDYTEKNIYDISSYYFFTMTFWVFDSMFTALTSFPQEREVILKERASGSYHLSAYFMAKTTADAPVRILLPFLYMVVSFWMAGFDHRFSVFIGTIGCTLLSVVAGEAIGLMVGASIYDLERAITVMTVVTLFLMLLGGFFVQNIPPFLTWAKYLSPFKYAFDSSLQIAFDRPVPCDGSGALAELCSESTTGFISSEDLKVAFGIQGTVLFNVGILLIFCFLPRYLAYVALRFKKEGERS